MHCEDATRAMSAAQERPLALGERAALRLHLALCGNCRNFERQVAFLRESMRTYARAPDDPPGTVRNDGRDSSSE